MHSSLWAAKDGSWAVCQGHGPTGIKGYIYRDGPVWRVKGVDKAVYLDEESAASAVLGEAFVSNGEFSVERSGETGIVRATTDVINELRADGWRIALRITRMSGV